MRIQRITEFVIKFFKIQNDIIVFEIMIKVTLNLINRVMMELLGFCNWIYWSVRSIWYSYYNVRRIDWWMLEALGGGIVFPIEILRVYSLTPIFISLPSFQFDFSLQASEQSVQSTNDARAGHCFGVQRECLFSDSVVQLRQPSIPAKQPSFDKASHLHRVRQGLCESKA